MTAIIKFQKLGKEVDDVGFGVFQRGEAVGPDHREVKVFLVSVAPDGPQGVPLLHLLVAADHQVSVEQVAVNVKDAGRGGTLNTYCGFWLFSARDAVFHPYYLSGFHGQNGIFLQSPGIGHVNGHPGVEKVIPCTLHSGTHVREHVSIFVVAPKVSTGEGDRKGEIPGLNQGACGRRKGHQNILLQESVVFFSGGKGRHIFVVGHKDPQVSENDRRRPEANPYPCGVVIHPDAVVMVLHGEKFHF